MKYIFSRGFSVTVWTNECDDIQVLGLQPPGKRPLFRENGMKLYGRQGLEELLGVRDRDWGEAEIEDEQFMEVVEGTDVLVFDKSHRADSDDEDEFGFGDLHLRDSVCAELWVLFRKKYWSRLWVIQELAVSPKTSKVLHY